MQRFVATDVFDYYKPSRCARRVALVGAGVPQQETDTPFSNLLRDLGGRHERAHLDSLRGVVDLTGLDPVTREGRTVEAIRDLAPAIYQPRFRTLVDVDVDGGTCELVGEPDFLLLDPDAGGYVVRDSKLARNISSDRHAGIPLQLQIYGFLFERNVGEPPARLEVHAGGGDIVAIEYEGADRVVDLLREHLRLRSADPNAYEPVGWSKCGGCGYEDRCRAQAVAAHDVALLPRAAVRARELHRLGIRTIAAVAAAVDDPALRDYFWTGKKRPHHKEFVAPLLANARAFLQNEPIPLEGSPALPDRPNLAMFDLEGLPPWLDELDRVYLWGMKVCGERPTGYLGAQAGFGVDGDREGWLAFLRAAGKLFADYGPDLPFVHWSGYERAKVQLYMDRYGDPAGVAARVLANSVDLLQLLKATVVLPLPSYSLKVVDEYVGFERRLAEANGSWSMAKYVEATETDDPATRAALVQEILAYNEEDLDATWAVMEWLRRFTSETSATAKGREPLLV